MKKQRLSQYDASPHKVGANKLKYLLWIICNAIFLKNPLNTSVALKRFLLKVFGAKIGKGVVLKPSINVKYPWKLSIGDHCWIGEHVWLDNVEPIHIADNVCISQGALLLTGSHDHKSESFDYSCGEIIVEEGVLIGAKAIVAKGVTCKSHSILSINSVAERDLDAFTIYKGNPAIPMVKRKILK